MNATLELTTAMNAATTIETVTDAMLPSHVLLLTEDENGAEIPSALLVGDDGRPDPQWVRGRCPECGDDLISNMYFSPGDGYIIRWECWSSRVHAGMNAGESPQCAYQRVL